MLIEGVMRIAKGESHHHDKNNDEDELVKDLLCEMLPRQDSPHLCFSTYARNDSGISLQCSSATLQPTQSNPRTFPVSWS